MACEDPGCESTAGLGKRVATVCVQRAHLRPERERSASVEGRQERRGAWISLPAGTRSQPESLTLYNSDGEHALATSLNLTVRDRHSLAIAGITEAGESPLLRAMTALWAELGGRARLQKLWPALGSWSDQSACPRRSSERHNAAVLRSAYVPAGLADLTESLDGTDTEPKWLHRRRMHEQQRPGFCPLILPPARYAPLREQRQGEAWESRERAEAATITATVPSNGGLAS